MLPHARDNRSSDSWSHVWSAPSDGAATSRSPSAMSCRVRAMRSSRVTTRHPGSSLRGRRGRAASMCPAGHRRSVRRRSAVTGRIPATLDDRNASRAPARSWRRNRPSAGRNPDALRPGQQPRSGRAGQDRAVERGRGELHHPVVGRGTDQEDVGGGPLGQEVVDGQEQRVVGAGSTGLQARVDVLGTGRGLEGGQRVLRDRAGRARRRGAGRVPGATREPARPAMPG